jgi:hypothetical protein
MRSFVGKAEVRRAQPDLVAKLGVADGDVMTQV